MSEELDAIAATLKRLQQTQGQQSAKRDEQFTTALQGIQASLSELVDLSEKRLDAKPESHGEVLERIAKAVAGIRMPDVNMEPRFEVAAPNVTISAPEVKVVQVPGPQVNNSVVVQPAMVEVMPAPTWTKLKIDFEYTGERLTGATLERA